MNRIYKVEDIVRKILQEYETTRSDDFELIVYVYNEINPTIKDYPFNAVMLGHKELGLPYFESVSRARRKLQAEDESLKPKKEVQIARINKQGDYINYAIDGYKSNFMDMVDSKE